MSKKCPECGREIEPWMTHCYEHYHKKKKDFEPQKLQKHHGGSK